MENLLIKATKNTPYIDFSKKGKLLLSGSAYPENVKEFFEPVVTWISSLQTTAVDFDIKLEYINTAATKKILELLKILESNMQINDFNVRWFYEKGDEDGLETGQVLGESLTRMNLDFVEY